MAIDKIFDGAVDGIADNLFNSVSNSVSEIKAMQQRKAAENVQLVVQALKKIDADIREKYDGVTETIEKRVANIKDGRDGIDGKNGLDGVNGKDGRDGKDGRNGRDGLTGPRGFDGPKGADGKDGRDGEDGVSVTDAHIDFDGSLIISLSSGRVINVGEVVAADIAEKIKVITNGGGTSQPVLDQLASLQAQIDLISSALVYKGTWNASTNTPTLTSSAGTANTFYIVSVGGTTTLNGISNWGVGDWAVYNGSVWQRIEGGAVGNFTDLSVSGTTTLSGLTASTALALNASKQVVSVTNTGSGNNVLATSPTLVTPVLGTPSSVTLTNATGLPLSTGVTGTLPIANGGTGQTTAAAAITALTGTQTTGYYLRSNGTTSFLSAIIASDVPTLNQSTTGSAGSLSTVLVTSSGGTGLTTFTNKGVLYASSTNALATGTALQFDGTNFGMGATPSAWATDFRSIEIGAKASLTYDSNAKNTRLSTNIYNILNLGRPYYKTNDFATEYSQNLGTHSWSTAPSGIAGPTTAITTGKLYTNSSAGNQADFGAPDGLVGTVWTATSSGTLSSGAVIQNVDYVESMRIDTSGNVGIGITNPGSKLNVKGTLRLSGSTSGYVGLAPAAAAGSTTYILPSADGTSGQSLVTDGSGTLSWASGTGGTVTSVAASVPTFLSISGSPITSSGTLAITLSGTALPTTSGGTGLTSFTSGGVVYASSTSALTTGSALTFNGTSLGVGTSSPNYLTTFYKASLPVLQIANSTSGSTSADGFLIYLNGANATISNEEAGALNFQTSGLLRATFDSSGNLGLGVTPSPWGTYNGVLDLKGNGALAAYNQSVNLSANTYYNGTGFIYKATTTAGYYQIAGNVHQWNIAPSGLANTTTIISGGVYAVYALGSSTLAQWQTFFSGLSALPTVGQSITATASGTLVGGGTVSQSITFTQAMTLDASGNLGVGTTSPVTKLHVMSSASSVTMSLSPSSSNTNIGYLTNDGTYLSLGSAYNSTGVKFRVALQAPDNAATLDSSGNLGIGTSSPSAKLHVSGVGRFARSTDASQYLNLTLETGNATYNAVGSINHVWQNAGTEQMRLDTSGNLGIGTSSPTAFGSGYTTLTISGSSTGIFQSKNTSGDTRLYANTDGDAYLGSWANTSLKIYTNSTVKATLDTSGNLGLGVTPSAWSGYGVPVIQLPNTGTIVSNDQFAYFGANWYYGTSAFRYITSSQAASYYGQTAGAHKWYTAPSGTAGNAITFTQAMTLDASGNLGIGTSSPANRLDIQGTTDTLVKIYRTNTTSGLALGADGNGAVIAPITNDNIQFYNAAQSVLRMKLDSSGNLGLGVTPSAWYTSYGTKAFQFAASGGLYGLDVSSTDRRVGLTNNSYINTSGLDTYINAGKATRYQQADGSHQFFTTGTGAAGGTVTWTQAMTLDASYNLGVGTTSPLARIHGKSTTGDILILDGSSTTTGAADTGARIAFVGHDGSVARDMGRIGYYKENATVGNYASYLSFVVRANGSGLSEAARITSGGYFKSSNTGTYIGATGTYNEFRQSDNNHILYVSCSNTSVTNSALFIVDANRNTTNNTFYALGYYNNAAAAYKWRVADSGNVTNTNGSYGTISDVKMKKDIVDAGSQWADIKAVRFRKFKMINDPDQIVQLGVIAQELEQTSSGLVEEHKDIDKDGNDLGTTTKSVKTSILLMKAAVALQEAMNRIEQLEARLDAANL